VFVDINLMISRNGHENCGLSAQELAGQLERLYSGIQQISRLSIPNKRS